MSLTSGFFNSINGDRKYNAEQMSSLFDGIINDGVFANIGRAFAVTAIGANDISVDEGRAWFNSTWIHNDYPVILTASASDVLYNRYDAVVIEVNRNDSVRACELKVVTGTPGTNPTYPTLTDNANVHQHPLAFIYRPANSSSITPANVINCVGGSYCPYITGILQVQDISKNVAQWEAEWDEWYAAKTTEVDRESSAWIVEKQTEMITWFNSIKGILDEDTAVSLANKMIEIEMKLEETQLDNVVMKTGGVMTGDLEFQPTENGGRSKVGRDETVANNHGLVLEDTNPSGKSMGLRICGGLNELQMLLQGVPYRIYSSYNKPTPSDIGAIPASGGTVTGELIVDNEAAAYGISKRRTIDGAKFSTDIGVGNDPVRGTSASMRLRNSAGTVIGRVDAWSNGSFTFSKDGTNFIDLLHGGDSSAAIACGTYKGTGVAGYNNPNSLTFGFKPKAIFVYYHYKNENAGTNDAPRLGYINVNALSDAEYKEGAFTSNISYSDATYHGDSWYAAYGKLSSDGKTVQWYSSNVSPYQQMNISNVTYYYVAIGL